jgi:ribosomal protein S18 acetylase RimI-like enzyme
VEQVTLHAILGGLKLLITFERATADDAEALVRIQIAAFHDDARIYPGVEIGGPPGYDSIDNLLRKIAEDECYKIVHEGQLIGGIVIFDRGQGHFHLDIICIDPDYHNQGIGTRAMQFIEEAYPATKWSLDTPDWAVRNRHFYEKLGFVKVGEEALPDITLICYEKRL